MKEIPELLSYFSWQELEKKKKEEQALQKARELEAILNGEMDRLQTHLDKKLQKQEQKFMEKLTQ